MSFLDIFRIGKFKRQIQRLNEEKQSLKDENTHLNQKLQFKLSLKQMNAEELDETIEKKKSSISDIRRKISKSIKRYRSLNLLIEDYGEKLEDIKAEIGDLDSERETSSYGLYRPHYNFASSLKYKDVLKDVRKKQRELIKYRKGVIYNPNWQVNGSFAKGRKNTKNEIKAIFRSFNNECTDAIKKVNYSNYDRIHKRISKSFEQHNKMYRVKEIRIRENYLDLKFQELDLAFEYAQKREEEKETLRLERAKAREDRAAKREMAKQRSKINKEIDHYDKAIKELHRNLKKKDSDQAGLQDEITKLKSELSDFYDQKDNIDYRVSNPTAGYVYIISNIGSFGKNIVKIGVTRRLTPEKRVQELSSASVPFKFDIHALIFSENAYHLETRLHHRFAKRRVNKINNRKEFFNISINEVKNELKKYKKATVDFHETPEANEYRKSLDIVHDNKKKLKDQKVLSNALASRKKQDY